MRVTSKMARIHSIIRNTPDSILELIDIYCCKLITNGNHYIIDFYDKAVKFDMSSENVVSNELVPSTSALTLRKSSCDCEYSVNISDVLFSDESNVK